MTRRAIFVDTTMHIMTGGAHIFLQRLLPQLTSRGWAVTLITEGRPEPSLAGEIRRSGIDVISDLWPFPSLVDDAAARLAGWVNAQGESVFVVSVSAGTGWAAIPALDARVAVAAIAHSDSETFYAPFRHYRPLLSAAVGVSKSIAQTLRHACRIEETRVHNVPYGVPGLPLTEPARELRWQERCMHVLFVGRFDHDAKRIRDVMKIGRSLSDDRIILTLVGDGPARREVQQELAGQIRRGRVVLEGWLPESQVLLRMRRSAALLLCSAYEGLPIVVLEAMAHGLVPVVSDISATQELVKDGVNGHLVPVGATDIFLRRLAELAENRERLTELRIEAWRTGQEYSLDRMADAYDRCLKQAIEVNRGAMGDGRPAAVYPLLASCSSVYPKWVRRLKVWLQRLPHALAVSPGPRN